MPLVLCKQTWCFNQAIDKMESNIKILKKFNKEAPEDFVIEASEIYLTDAKNSDAGIGKLIENS